MGREWGKRQADDDTTKSRGKGNGKWVGQSDNGKEE